MQSSLQRSYNNYTVQRDQSEIETWKNLELTGFFERLCREGSITLLEVGSGPGRDSLFFVMDSGVRLLEPHLREAAERGAEICMLAGDYLYITQPRALRRLMQIHPAIEVRFWISDGQFFNPKAYLLDYDNGEGILIVGSSNLSALALHVGYEWNLVMNAQAEPSTFQEALDQFMHLFYDERTAPLNEETIARYTRKRTTVSSKRIRNSCSWRCGWMRKNGYLRTRNRRKKPPTPQQIPQPKRRRQSFPDSRNRKPSKHSWRPSRKATTGPCW